MWHHFQKYLCLSTMQGPSFQLGNYYLSSAKQSCWHGFRLLGWVFGFGFERSSLKNMLFGFVAIHINHPLSWG